MFRKDEEGILVMSNLKIMIASLLVLSSSQIFAGQVEIVNVPEPVATASAWDFGASALYLQPSFGGNGLGYNSYSNYAGADNQGVIITDDGTNYIHHVTPPWGWGFALEGSYHRSTGSDITVNWQHLDESENGHLPEGSLFSGSVDGFYADRLELATKWDAVNLEIGKPIYFSSKKLLRLHAGLAFANIKNTFTNHPKLFQTGSEYFTSKDKMSYTGFGPRIGMDFNDVVGKGFSVFAKAAGSVLWGTSKQHISGYQNVVNTVYGVIPFGSANFSYSYNNVLVPELEAKLGIGYDYAFTKGDLRLDLGYLWMDYIDAVSSYMGIGVVGSSLGIPTTANFNLNGPYFSVKWTTA